MEQQLLCPLCKSVSPGDATSCTQCGALFAQASAVGTAAAPWELSARQPAQAAAATATAPPPVQSEPATQEAPRAAPNVPSPATRGWGLREQRNGADPLLDMPSTPLPHHEAVNKPTGVAAPHHGVGWPSWVAAVLVAVGIVAMGLYGAAHGWFGSSSSKSLHNTLVTPTSIAGAAAVPDSSWTQIASSIRTGLAYGQGITRTVSSVYGTAAQPEMIFVGEQGPGVTTTSTAQGLQQFAGISNYAVAASSEVSTTLGGVPYVCGVVTGGSPAAICAYTDGQTRGFVWVVNSADLNNAENITQSAHAASLR